MLESPYYVDIFEGTNNPLEVAQASLSSIIDVPSAVQLKDDKLTLGLNL